MPKQRSKLPDSVLVRGLSGDDLAWIRAEASHTNLTQNEFLLRLIREYRVEHRQLSLFEHTPLYTMVQGGPFFRFIDLFAGIGGFRCAITALGGECVFTSEWDKYSAQTYRTWYRDSEVCTEDIRQIDIADNIPLHDILCAGFPCQPFSLAGVSKKKSLGRSHGFEDERQGNLFFTIMDIVDVKRPPVLFLENVKNLRSHDKGNTWGVIKSEIERRGYEVFDKVIDASGWVPQHRERVFIVCFDRDVFGAREDIGFQFPEPPVGDAPTLEQVLQPGPPDKKYMLSDKLWAYLQDYARKHREKGNGFGYSLFGKGDVARTLSARYHKDGSEILIKQRGWKNPRRLTPQEAMALMGFNDEYAERFRHYGGFPQVVSDTQAYRQFGNAVVPPVVEAIGRNILSVVTKTHRSKGSGCLLKGRLLEPA